MRQTRFTGLFEISEAKCLSDAIVFTAYLAVLHAH